MSNNNKKLVNNITKFNNWQVEEYNIIINTLIIKLKSKRKVIYIQTNELQHFYLLKNLDKGNILSFTFLLEANPVPRWYIASKVFIKVKQI